MRFFYNLLCLSFVFFLVSCDKDEKTTKEVEGQWTKGWSGYDYNYGGAVNFKIGDECYVGLGRWTYAIPEIFYFTPDAGKERIATFPGGARTYASSFVIGNKVHIGLGRSYPVSPDDTDDFHAYDFTTQEWETLPQFPGDARQEAFAFSMNGNGYVGGGNGRTGSYFTDFYKFHTQEGWTKLPAPGLQRVVGNTVFVIGNKAYHCLGKSPDSGEYSKLMFVFDGETEEWSALRTDIPDMPELLRSYATSFVMTVDGREYAYIISGENNGDKLLSCFKYDPVANKFTRIKDIPKPFVHGLGLVTNDKAYLINGLETGEDAVWIYEPIVTEEKEEAEEDL